MAQTLTVILPWLQFFAGGGSGVLASWMFDRLRASRPQATIPAGHWLAVVLYAPRYARFIVLVLGAIISVGASVLVALLTAGDLPAVFDAAFAAAISGVASQVMHARQLSTTPQEPARPPTPPPDPVFHYTPAEPWTRPEARHGSAGPAVPYRPDPEAEPFTGVNHGIKPESGDYDGPDRRRLDTRDFYRGVERRKPRRPTGSSRGPGPDQEWPA